MGTAGRHRHVLRHRWLLTDPDAGPAGRYVSACYLSRWGDDEARGNDGNEVPDL